MSQLFVKICGISTMDAAAAVADSGADAIGFVFAPGSPREVAPEQARLLQTALPPSIETVGVFRNQPIDTVLRTARLAGVATVQLHGDETDAEFDRLRAEGFDTIRALSIDDYLRLTNAGQLRSVDRLLIDAVTPGGGAAFDPAPLLDAAPVDFWILAGGLNPQNVAELVRSVRPGGVDVSSGVEASRGVKHPALIRRFVAEARSA
ncbi:phosphoribosylanthranilate isomerase [Salinibacterium sp. M195]|uniref:phosphoribosylanthranilate isomerase n=1 Tax=Salinibacterium sp. M195 TaxID=2583374 RepID=UPI001C62F203|nr:phosphoribosylanthranilate isomerase [Salinibacterium sp. M195]QYH35164.1 phosphoribosylanthranilate isomerase [Salinibacterium sp. M195]